MMMWWLWLTMGHFWESLKIDEHSISLVYFFGTFKLMLLALFSHWPVIQLYRTQVNGVIAFIHPFLDSGGCSWGSTYYSIIWFDPSQCAVILIFSYLCDTHCTSPWHMQIRPWNPNCHHERNQHLHAFACFECLFCTVLDQFELIW